MKRQIASAVGTALLLGVAGLAPAETGTPFAVKAEAKQSDQGQILVKVVVTRTTDGKTETLSSPSLVISDGQRASLIVGAVTEATKAVGSGPQPDHILVEGNVIESGVQVDLISTKGKDEVLVISFVTEKGEIIWAEARTVKVEGAPAGKASMGGRQAVPPVSVSAEAGHRVVIDWKYRRPNGQGAWGEGSTRFLIRASAPLALWAENRRSEDLIQWEAAGPSIKGLKGRLVPAEPGDFDAPQIRASADRFKSAGHTLYPVAVGKVFAIRYGEASRGGEGEALIRIRSIEPSGETTTRPAGTR